MTPESRRQLHGKYVLLSARPVREADGRFTAFCDELGLVTVAATEEGALERLGNLVRRTLEAATARGDILEFLDGRGVRLHPLEAPRSMVITLAEPEPGRPAWVQLAEQFSIGTVRHSGYLAFA